MMNQKPNIKIPQKIKPPSSRKDNPTLSRSSSASTLTSVTEVRSDAGDPAGEDAEQYAIGDKVWVNGTKPGFIQYIGETQFAPGVWAGVMLDDPIGKNDGSVAGVRYFSCEPKRGIFARPHRLTRQAGTPPKIGDVSGNGTFTPATTSKTNPAKTGITLKGANGSCSSGSITPSRTISSCSRPKVSERVIVNATSGVKIGTLRYLGITDFAAGDWAGIELDEPLGKNDGSVAGKRYFDCRMKYGLFAPLHKVSRASGTATPRQSSAGTSPLHHRSSSHESLNSSLSSSSAARVGRVKLGVTSLTSIQKATRSAATTVTATNAALQEALKEKEEHIEQLLKERDLERAEVARAASQVDEAEQKLSELQVEHQRYVEENEQRIIHMKELLEVADNEYKKGTALLEEEKRKSEDLQFRVEEDTIAIGDLEAQIEKDHTRIKDLEEILTKDKPLLEEPFNETNKFVDLNVEITTYKEQIIELTERVKTLENELKSYEISEEVSTETHEFQEKLNRSKQSLLLLETSMREKDNEITTMQHKISEFTTKLDESNECTKKQSEELKELHEKCTSSEKLCETLSKENSLLQEQVANMNIKGKSEEICDTNEQLKKKDKQIENLESQLSFIKEELENIKATTFSLQVQQKEEIEKLTLEHSEKMKSWEEKHDNLKNELQKVTDNAQEISQSVKEKECRLENKEAELNRKCQEVEDKQKQISELTILLEESRLQTQTLNEQKAADQSILEGKISKLQLELNNVLQEKNQNVQCITKELKKLTQLLKEKDELQKEKENQMNTLQKCVEDKTTQISLLSSQLHNAEEKFKILCKENTDKYSLLQDTIAQAQVEKEIALKEHEENYESKIERLSQIINEKDNNVLLKESTITTLTDKVDEQENELNKIKNHLKEKELEQENMMRENKSANDELSKKLAQMEIDYKQLLKERDMSLESTASEIERLNIKLKEKENELMETEINRKGLQKTIDDKENEIAELNLKIKEMEQEFQKVSQQSSETSNILQDQISEFRTQLEKLQKDKDEIKKEKEEMLSNLLKEKEQTSEERQTEITTLKVRIKEKEDEITSLGLQLEEMKAKLEFQTKNGSSLRNEFESQILQLQAQCNKLLNEKDEMTKQQQIFQETQKKLEMQRDLLIQGKAEQEAIVSDREAKLAVVQSEVNRMQTEFTKHKEELQQKLDITETELQAMQELKKQLELQREDLEELHKNLQNTENERLKLEQQVQSMNTVVEDKIQLENKLATLQQQCDEATVKKTDLEKNISVLEKLVESNQVLLTEKEKEMQALRKQVETVQIEALESKKLKCALKTAEEEKELLEKKVVEYQTTVSDSNVNANLTELESGKQEKDALLSQIDFLNSIIVDMQKKNEELTARISILETGEVFEENDMNLNGIKTRMAPRLFCDICDMFDLHDTEDCPKQSSLAEEEMTHSRHHGSRSEPRPYCNNCEVFGHWTSECDDQETF